MSAPAIAQGQSNRAPTGGRMLVTLNLAGAQPGILPPEIDLQTGALDVVEKNGRRMLRAASATAFLVNLPERLPRDFLLELEFIPKMTASSMDFSVEGTRNENMGDESTNLMWFSSNVRAVGGGSHFDAPMPSSMAAALAGVPTHVAIWIQDRLMRVYTNGELTHTIPNRRFVRNPFLRVFLGGENDEQEAVYLSGLRISDMGLATATSANASTAGSREPPGSLGSQQGGASGGVPGSGNRGSTSPNSTGSSSGAPAPNAITNLTVTDSPNGPIVSWVGVPSALYAVERWLLADPRCCAASSPASPLLTSPTWQDTPLSVSGTYLYKVTSMTASSSVTAEVQFAYTRPSSGPPIPDRTQSPERIQTTTSTSPAPPTPSVTSPTGANAGTIRPAVTVSVTMGAAGPVVAWNLVPNATAYSVSRWKADNPNCCNNTSGRAMSTSWQDQPLSVSGTYVYRVSALSPVGEVSGETQFVYQAPSATATQQAPTMLPATPPSGTAILTPAPTASSSPTSAPADTSMRTSAASSGRYRVTMTGVQVARPTADDPLDRDGKADEIFANAIVVRSDRQGSRSLGTLIVKSREYGDVGNGTTWPYRIRAGTALPSGGITVGNVVPFGFVPSARLATPNAETFPIALWEGTLTDGGEAVVLFPSVWERDIDDVAYKNYTANWMNNTAPVLQSQVLLNQYASTALLAVEGPTDIGTFGQAAAGTTFTQPNYGVYAIPAMSLMAPVDRLIGMTTVGGALAYPERILVVTREKLASLAPGGYVDLQIPLVERALGTDGIYTMYLRVERLP